MSFRRNFFLAGIFFFFNKASLALNLIDLPNDMLFLICQELAKTNIGECLRFFRSSKELYNRSEDILQIIADHKTPFLFPIFTNLSSRQRLMQILYYKNQKSYFDDIEIFDIETSINKKIDALIDGCNCFRLILSKDKELYSKGANIDGELGLGDNVERLKPCLIGGELKKKKVIIAGNGHHCSFALTSDGLVYAWGSNNNGGLGFGNMEKINSPKPLEGQLKGKKIIAICSDDHRRMVLTNDGKIYWWGEKNSKSHFLCKNENEIQKEPEILKNNLDDQQVIWITSGRCQSLILTASGQVYIWGCYQYTNISLVEGGLKGKVVISICSGTRHCLALTSDGEVYSWGENEYGQLGLGCINNISNPTLIGGPLKDIKIKEIKAKKHQSMAISFDNKVYVWGSNYKDILIPTLRE